MHRLIRFPVLWAVLVVLAAPVGCGVAAAEYCDAECDCEGCSDKEYDECIIRAESRIEEGSIYGCDDEYEALRVCRIDKSECNDDTFLLECDANGGCDCDDELEDVTECRDDASDENLEIVDD